MVLLYSIYVILVKKVNVNIEVLGFVSILFRRFRNDFIGDGTVGDGIS